MEDLRNCYVYSHFRQDKLEIFNIGIGKTKDYGRAYSRDQRNKHWRSIVKLNPNYLVDILFDNLTWKEACEKEIELIAKIGRDDLGLGTLCNQTNGGDGCIGVQCSLATREKLRNSRLGAKATLESKVRMSMAQTGRVVSEETKEKLRQANLGKKASEETKIKMSRAMKGRKIPHPERNIPIIQMDLEENFIKEWNSIKEAAETLNIDNSSIAKACKRILYKSAGKFKWKYKE